MGVGGWVGVGVGVHFLSVLSVWTGQEPNTVCR